MAKPFSVQASSSTDSAARIAATYTGDVADPKKTLAKAFTSVAKEISDFVDADLLAKRQRGEPQYPRSGNTAYVRLQLMDGDGEILRKWYLKDGPYNPPKTTGVERALQSALNATGRDLVKMEFDVDFETQRIVTVGVYVTSSKAAAPGNDLFEVGQPVPPRTEPVALASNEPIVPREDYLAIVRHLERDAASGSLVSPAGGRLSLPEELALIRHEVGRLAAQRTGS